MTCATGFCNAISVQILRREPSPLPVAKPTGFTPVAPPMTFSRHYLAQRATLDAVDLAEVQGCRRAHNQLGFAYQVGFVRLLNRFPKQQPFEVLDELLLFTGMQLGVNST